MIRAAKKRIAEGKLENPMIVATWQSKFGEEQHVAIPRNERNIKTLASLKENNASCFSSLLGSRFWALREVSDEKATKLENEIDESDTFDIGFCTTLMEDTVISKMKKKIEEEFYWSNKHPFVVQKLLWENKDRELFEVLDMSPSGYVNFALERAFSNDWFEISYEGLCENENS